jgi:HEAT repeat protein
VLSFLLLAAACTSTSPQAEARCRVLVDATPEHWGRALPPVLALGPEAAPDLVRSLRHSPDGAGRQAALCALGALGNPDAVPFLVDELHTARPYRYEAALALGQLRDPRALEPLRRLAADAAADVTTRTAAACALLDLGAAADAVPLLLAVLLAGTPDGQALAEAHRLPAQSRWALERSLVIDAIGRFANGETFGLDADASWPRLELGAEAFLRAVAPSAQAPDQG